MSVVTILPDCKNGMKTNASNTPSSVNHSRMSLKSMESMYTTSSSKFSALNRRKVNQRNRDRNPSLVPAVSEIKQRVMSARMLRLKQLQNQIGEFQHRIAELTAENRLLKSLHKRQDSALTKYESSSAELPRLLNSHSEEIRVWQTRCRNLQRQNKEILGKIKQKDTIILTLTDQNKHLLQLNRDKNLEEREKLAERVKDLEMRLLDKDNDMKLLGRRLQLESKAYKTNLNMEQQKYRDLLSKIQISDFMLHQAEKSEKKQHKNLQLNHNAKSPPRSVGSKSATSLTNGKEQVPLILPPCEGQTAKKEETVKTNSPRINVNSNVKLLQNTVVADEEEVDLTKNRNGHRHDDDEITVTIRNGMSRARGPQKSTKVPAKLTPLHPKETKKSSDDSELSDDDLQLFSEHNGTKMAHNARDLLAHKLHLSELESKMKQNSLDVKKHEASSSSSSSLSDHHQSSVDDIPVHSLNDRGDHEFASIEREMRNSMMRRESFLEEYCDTFADDKSDFRSRKSTTTLTKVKKLELAQPTTVVYNSPKHNQTQATSNGHHHSKSNGAVLGRQPAIDNKKKSSLLAALKHIDDDSLDN